MGNAGFMVGVLLAALERFHEETGDAAVGQAIVHAARYLVDDMWEPQRGAFRYTSCPGSHVHAVLIANVIEGIGYAWRLCGDERLKQVLLADLDTGLSTPYNSTNPPVGKDISTHLRNMPFTLHDMISAGGSLGDQAPSNYLGGLFGGLSHSLRRADRRGPDSPAGRPSAPG